MTMPESKQYKILAFDTASRRGSVALLEGTGLRAELKQHHLENHSLNLIPSIQFLLDGAGWSLGDLDLVAVGTGPGSFTGIRIGMATGMGIAQSLAVPFAGISGLEALAYQSRSFEGSVGVLLNAQRSQAYYSEYINSEGRMRIVRKPSLLHISDLEEYLKKRPIALAGDNDLCRALLSNMSKKHSRRFLEMDLYLASSIGRCALGSKRKWRKGSIIQCEPLYIRPPDALRNRGKTR
jgi:tRNA threonylcarbamoyladenosine biosynthesis protein TsaB